MINARPETVGSDLQRAIHIYTLEKFDDVLREVRARVESREEALENKHLYLGWQGADNWREVERANALQKQSDQLLKENLAKIHEFVSEGLEGPYDIVSLGCGTGTDDAAILRFLLGTANRKNSGAFSLTLIDLSWELLRCAVEQVEQTLSDRTHIRRPEYRDVHLCGLCVDLTHLGISESFIGNSGIFRKCDRALFHLLGLTIGNNHELSLLRSIASVMKEGDYLLMGVDCSGDNGKLLAESEKAYSNSAVQRFLSGPACFLMPWLTRPAPGGDIERSGGRASSWWSNMQRIEIETGRSDIDHSSVPEAVSFTRYHVYRDSRGNCIGPNRLCDFSNKYTKSGLTGFLDKLKDNGVALERVAPVDAFGAQHEVGPPQYLVLLRRAADALPGVPGGTVEEIRNLILARALRIAMGDEQLPGLAQPEIDALCNPTKARPPALRAALQKLADDELQSRSKEVKARTAAIVESALVEFTKKEGTLNE